MFEFAGVYINPYEIAYCEVMRPPHQRPELYVTLTSGDSFTESFDTMDYLREVLDEIASFIDPLVEE